MSNQTTGQNLGGWRLPEVLSPTWQGASAAAALTGESTHVWRTSLNLPLCELEKCLLLLAADERERAARFYKDVDRNRFIAARGTLRMLLSRYLNLAPERIALRCNPHGKPLLAENSAQPTLHFNLTRRQDLALYAFAWNPVGIDVELEEANTEFEQLLPHVASADEMTKLETLPDCERRQAFLHLWTRKEALLKNAGTGFSFPPSQITVLTESGEIDRNLMPGFDVFGKWIAFSPGAGFLAALTAPAIEAIKWFHWQ
jgi:4'-phosphopantetheinyl transferase